MKVLPFTIIKSKQDSLILQEDIEGEFYSQLHQHKELQISLIKKGEGSLLVGNTFNNYKEGDLFVFGSNLPHVFNSDTSKIKKSYMMTLFFTKDSFGEGFFEIEELKSLKSFLKKTENGIKLSVSKNTTITFEKLFKTNKLNRFILFLTLLKQLNGSKFNSLSSFIPLKKFSDVEGKRMNAVFNYTVSNYQNEISLETISDKANMTKNAFCKYFKKRTNKTYTTFLNELRIEKACSLLQTKTEYTIAEIAEKSGFQNISNFNRKFKQFKNVSPREFRRYSK